MIDRKHTRTKKRRWPWIIAGILLLIGLWQLVASLYQEEEKQLRRQLRESIKEKFPEQTAEFSKTFGLFFFEADREATSGVAPDRKSVVLVHGLDDPGQVWQNLAPELVKADFNVWLMHYPNDQPVVESARLFFEALQGLKPNGIDRISIVAHSMGGLVTVESTRLAGVPHRTVDGTHLSMIRNITSGSRRIPPAVPIIIDQLKKPVTQ